jgi:glycine/D-amino acid oxidase-like deaminating enzyme
MRAAIVGAGFAGLALAWHLLQVDVFDPLGIGGGASGVSTGLLHPYPGEQGRLSLRAYEGIASTKKLLQHAAEALGTKVADESGIIRLVWNEEQHEVFSRYPDVSLLEKNVFLIRSGITVYPSLYLRGLWLACERKGGRLHHQKIDSTMSLASYDRTIVAAGAGVFGFKESQELKLKRIKGQILTCRKKSGSPPLERSIIAKGYAAKDISEDLFHLGSTYEKEFVSAEPDLKVATELLLPKLAAFGMEGDVVGCRAGIRVSFMNHYMPSIVRWGEKCWAVTGLGSRGLLYHGLLAEEYRAKYL